MCNCIILWYKILTFYHRSLKGILGVIELVLKGIDKLPQKQTTQSFNTKRNSSGRENLKGFPLSSVPSLPELQPVTHSSEYQICTILSGVDFRVRKSVKSCAFLLRRRRVFAPALRAIFQARNSNFYS